MRRNDSYKAGFVHPEALPCSNELDHNYVNYYRSELFNNEGKDQESIKSSISPDPFLCHSPVYVFIGLKIISPFKNQTCSFGLLGCGISKQDTA